MMNIDWFQPFKNRNDYSVGVIYFVLLNLPRNIRFRSENVIIAGLIPAFKKEPHSINSFLNPIVEELQVLWKGVRLESLRNTEVYYAWIFCKSWCTKDVFLKLRFIFRRTRIFPRNTPTSLLA